MPVHFAKKTKRFFWLLVPTCCVVQGAYRKFLQNILDIFEAYDKATETCNTAMELEFCWLFEDSFEDCEKSFYEA